MKSGSTLAIFNLAGKIPVTRDWLMISVSGFIKAGLNVLNSFTEISSTPAEILVRKDDRCLRTLVLLTNENENDVSTRF